MQRSSAILLLPLLAAGAAAAPAPGVPSYWDPLSAAFATLPRGALALVNPHNGIFKGETTQLADDLAPYQAWVELSTRREVRFLGYVPTGYFDHGCDIDAQCQTWPRIEAQVQAYFAQFPRLEGIFYDEAAPADGTCAAYLAEYARLRAIVAAARPGATIAFNPGWPDRCAVAAARPGEIVTLFEGSGSAYARQAPAVASVTAAARRAGVRSWHLVYAVPTRARLRQAFGLAGLLDPDFFYATDIGGDWQAGDDTWGAPPAYWRTERALYAR